MRSPAEVQRRRFHAFISHAHADRAAVDRLYDWLNHVARAQVFYDAVDVPPGASIAIDLAEAIGQSRALLLVLSRTSVGRGWVQEEYSAALNHRTQHPSFGIVPVRIDDVEPPGLLGNYSYLEAPEGVLTVPSAIELLLALYRSDTGSQPRGVQDIYVSRSAGTTRRRHRTQFAQYSPKPASG